MADKQTAPLEKQTPSHEEHLEDASAFDAQESVDDIADKRITRLLDARILPWLFLLWLLAFIDRSNIGNAKLNGLTKDLQMENTKYNTALAVFYILYILLDVPSNWLLKRVGGGTYLPLLCITWGITSTCVGAVQSYGGLIAARLVLGACEGGMFGGIILYLSMFFKRHELMFRLGCFYCAAPLSGAIGGLLATGFGKIAYHNVHSWRWIFLIEGAITVLAGATALFFLPNTPGTAKFLTKEQRLVAEARLRIDTQGSVSNSTQVDHFQWSQARRALLNVNTLLMSLNFFLILIPIYSYSLFLPTIISGMGYTAVHAQLFTVPPNFLAFLSVLAACRISDRYKKRGPLILLGMTLGMIGYVILITGQRPTVRYVGTFFVAAGVFPCSPMVLGWLSNNLAPHYVRATGIGFQVAVGNCSAFIATFTYLVQDQPRYIKGHAINLGAIVLVFVVTSLNMMYCAWENKQRAQGKRDDRISEAGEEGDLGSSHPIFRYTL